MEGLLLCHAHFGWECLYCQCPSPTQSRKGQKMTKKNVTVNYNGESLKADEVLVFTPYDEEDVKNNVTNKESIVTITKAGKSVKAVLKAVPKEFEAVAKAQFNSWQREQLPAPTEGRCMIPQPDGTYKECPKKNGDNRISCINCPNKGKYDRKLIARISIEEQQDENGLTLAEAPAADSVLIEEENLTEAQQRIVAKFEAMMDKSPKHCLAMLLMGMGYKGEEFATRMHLKHDAANRIRNQVLGTAPEGISDFDQIDTQNFSANKVGDTEYYRAEAQKALETLLKMYF